MLSLFHLTAGISWEPEIRGALVVLVGSAVLMGSVWLVLSTNLGNRLGTLNAVAGFFGWMFIMGVVWWVYGIGRQGDPPVWEPKELIIDDVGDSVLGTVRDLEDAELVPASELIDRLCPGLVNATVDLQRARFLEKNADLVLNYDGPPYCSEAVGELLAVDAETISDNLTAANMALSPDDPRFAEGNQLSLDISNAIDNENRKLQQLTLSTLAAAPELVDIAEAEGTLDFVGWNLQSSAEAGEAIASADAFLISDPASPFSSSSDFFVLNTFQKGGKPKRASDGVWDRVWNEVRNSVVFWHPTNRVVVQVAPTLDKELIPGQAPPFAEIDPEGDIVSVVMVRDLGSRRLPAALMTVGSLLVFLGLCWMLHVRDLELRRRVDEWNPNLVT